MEKAYFKKKIESEMSKLDHLKQFMKVFVLITDRLLRKRLYRQDQSIIEFKSHSIRYYRRF